MSWNDKIPYSDGYERLVREGAAGKRPRVENPDRLPLNEIAMAHSVLQPRTFSGNMSESAAHVANLAAAIRNNPAHKLDPIVIWWSGEHWRCLDGHHRLLAYQQVRDDVKRQIVLGPVPVAVFTGTLDAAIAEATNLNSKDKLNMTVTDKLDRAWKLVALNSKNKLTKPEIAAIAKVSERTVGNMRKAHTELLTRMEAEDAGGFGKGAFDQLLNLGWADVKKRTIVEKDRDEEWAEKMAREWARRLAKTFGIKLARNPEIAARALALYSDKLPELLVSEWQGGGDYGGDEDEDAAPTDPQLDPQLDPQTCIPQG